MNVTWVHPWALWAAAAAAAIPVIVHFLARPRPLRRPHSSIELLRQVMRERRTRSRIRDLLVLSARVAALCLLTLGFARPGSDGALARDPVIDRPVTRVIVLDCSRSMSARRGGLSVFERARASTARYLESRPGLRLHLVLAGARPRPVFEGPTGNVAALIQELRAAAVRQEEMDVPAAIAHAGAVLAAAAGPPGGGRELVIVSDLQRTTWGGASLAGLPEDVSILVESAALPEPPPNLAPVRVVPDRSPGPGGAVRVQVEVANHGDARAAARLALHTADGAVAAQVEVAAWSTARVPLEVPGGAGAWLTGRVELVEAGDGLPDDDVLHFAFSREDRPRVMLLTSDDAESAGTSAYYLTCALEPEDSLELPWHFERRDLPGIEAAQLLGAGVILIAGAGRVDSSRAAMLASAVRGGRSLLVVVQEPEDAATLVSLAAAMGPGFRLPLETVRPGAKSPGRHGLQLARVNRGSAPFSAFGDRFDTAFSRLRFGGGAALSAPPGHAVPEVLAAYDDGSAALALIPAGDGWLCILNADLEASDIVRSGSFVPLIVELVRDLLARRGGGWEPMRPGRPYTAYVDAGGSPEGLAVVRLPGEEIEAARFDRDALGVTLHLDEAPAPGLIEVRRDRQSLLVRASVCPEAESDLRAIEAGALRRAAGDHPGSLTLVLPESASEDPLARRELWPALLLGLFAAVCFETAVLKATGS